MSERRIVVCGGVEGIGYAIACMFSDNIGAVIVADSAASFERNVIELKAQRIDLPEVVLPESHRPRHRSKGERKRNRKNRWR